MVSLARRTGDERTVLNCSVLLDGAAVHSRLGRRRDGTARCRPVVTCTPRENPCRIGPPALETYRHAPLIGLVLQKRREGDLNSRVREDSRFRIYRLGRARLSRLTLTYPGDLFTGFDFLSPCHRFAHDRSGVRAARVATPAPPRRVDYPVFFMPAAIPLTVSRRVRSSMSVRWVRLSR